MRSAELGLERAGLLPAAGPQAVGANGGGRGFDSLFRQLQGEVTRFIEQGSGAAALSPEGQWSRQRVQAQAGASAPAGEGADAAQRQAFVDQMLPLAREAAQALGVAPEVLTAHAALETGWGRAPLRRADGSDSHNLFGIKAGGAWQGEVLQAMTTEVEQGQAMARREAFRGYGDASQSFGDLARLLSGNTRYQAALGSGADARAYGQALQRGGYATDPDYADKLARVAAQIQGGRR